MQLLRRLRFTMLLMLSMTLLACGDGEGDLTGGLNGDTPSEGEITLTVDTQAGIILSSTQDVLISAKLLDAAGKGLSQKTITFTIDNDSYGYFFNRPEGTATTNADGIASITLKAGDLEGSATIAANYLALVDDVSVPSLGDGVKTVDGGPQAFSISLFSSSRQLASSGAQSIELSAIAKDKNNNLLEGVIINFSADSGALEKPLDEAGNSTNTTGPDGKMTMKLSTKNEPRNRDIIVIVSNGDISDSLDIEVVGSSVTLTGSASLALNDAATYIVNVLDSDGKGVAKTPVLISLTGISTETPLSNVANIALPTPTTVVTDSEGLVSVKVTGTSAGTNSIIVSALGAKASQNVSVQADSFLFTGFSNGDSSVDPSKNPVLPDVSLAKTAVVTLTWQRNLVPVVGQKVTFTTTRGTLLASDGITTVTEGITDAEGKVTVYLTSTNAGKATVTLVGIDNGQAVELTNQISFEFFADTAASIKAQASPNSIGPNKQKSTISVVVKDANGNLVKNKKIKFILTDVSSGVISPATAVTNSSGSAVTVYTSNSTSAKDGVSIRAIVEDSPAIQDNVTLTVSDRELFISLGTGNKIEELGTTDYVKEYSVFVTDAESNAVENIELTVSAIPESYYKGFWMPTYEGDDFVVWAAAAEGSTAKPTVLIAPTKCNNEDSNFNGILDSGEDFNGDGELTPGNIVAISGDFITDRDGRSVIRIIYPQSYAHWLDAKLVVSGKVTGSESSTQTIFTLPVLAEHITNEKLAPPTQGIGTRSPFGLSNVCSDNISQD